MGGSALGRPARRLTTPQHDLLKQHCIKLLSPSMFNSVIALMANREKDSHGDLDLLCSYDEKINGKKVKGEDWGVIVNGEDKGVGAHHPVQPLSEANKITEREKEGEENAEFREWVVEVVKAVKGDQWKRSGTGSIVISLGIPCNNIEGIEVEDEGVDYEPFYQVDLQLVPERYIQFTSFTRSWGNTVLSHGVSYLSPSIKLHGTHLGLHYSPYFGLEPIKIELTPSPKELCDWLGLDFADLEKGFDNEKGLWKWATDVKAGGRIESAWKIVANPVRKNKKVGKHSKTKDEKWAGFVRWLRRGEDSPHRQVEEPSTPVKQIIADPSVDTPSTLVGDAPVKSERAESSPALVTSTAQLTPTGQPTSPTASTTDLRSLVDPEKPVKLDKVAQEAIELFNKVTEVEEMLKKRKVAAIALAERQKQKMDAALVQPEVTPVAVEAVAGDQVTVLEQQVERVVIKE